MLNSPNTYRQALLQPLRKFLRERCVSGEAYRSWSGDLFEAFDKWQRTQPMSPISRTMFSALLADHGLTFGRTASARYVVGVALKKE